MPSIEFEYISEKVDLEKQPNASGVIDDEQITIGDLHGNALKFIWVLLRHGFLTSISEKDYERLVAIYNTNIKTLDGEDLDDFDKIVENLQLELNASQAVLTLLGDELADRGANDYFTLKIIQRLNQIGLKYEIIYSNHSFEFLRAYELYKQGRFSFEKVVTNASPTTSLENLQKLMQKELVNIEDIEDIIETAYKPAFKLLSYTLNQEQNTITIKSHAPIDVNVISAAAEQLTVEFFDATATELAQTIDTMNAAFNALVEDYEVSSTVQRKTPLYQIMWNRDWRSLNRSAIHNSYHINYVHGHTGGPTEGNVVDLDNRLGKNQRSNSGEYTALKRQAAQIHIQNTEQKQENTNKPKMSITLVNGHYYPNDWIEIYDKQHPDSPFNELNEEILSNSGRENLNLLHTALLHTLLDNSSVVDDAKCVEDMIFFGNWKFPADLVEAYNKDKKQYNQFECRALSRTDTFQKLYVMLLTDYSRKGNEKKYHVSAPYQIYANQEITKEQSVSKSVMGLHIDQEANYALVNFMDEAIDFKYMRAFEEIYEYDFKDYMVNQEALDEWLQLKKQGKTIPSILKDAYKQQQSLFIDSQETNGIKRKIEPAVVKTHPSNQSPIHVTEPVLLDRQQKIADIPVNRGEVSPNENAQSKQPTTEPKKMPEEIRAQTYQIAKLQIEDILRNFKSKIDSEIGSHSSTAKTAALALHKQLIHFKDNAFYTPNKESLAEFVKNTKQSIKEATPQLQRDLTWGSYLHNLAKKIANVIFSIVSFGMCSAAFFKPQSSDAVNTAKKVEDTIEQATTNKSLGHD